MELVARQAVGTGNADQQHPLNVYYEELDVNDRDFGIQGFVYKKILDAGVATAIGSPVGSTQASGGGIVTPDQSDSGAGGVFGGGIAQYVVAAGTTSFGWVQRYGISRTIVKTTGALAAGVFGRWSGDDTVAAITAGTDDAEGFCWNLVAASGGSVAAGGTLLLK